MTKDIMWLVAVIANPPISMDRRGGFWGYIFLEHFIEWTGFAIKYEHVYLYDNDSVFDLVNGMDNYVHFHKIQRPHASFERTPLEAYQSCAAAPG